MDKFMEGARDPLESQRYITQNAAVSDDSGKPQEHPGVRISTMHSFLFSGCELTCALPCCVGQALHSAARHQAVVGARTSRSGRTGKERYWRSANRSRPKNRYDRKLRTAHEWLYVCLSRGGRNPRVRRRRAGAMERKQEPVQNFFAKSEAEPQFTARKEQRQPTDIKSMGLVGGKSGS